MDTSSRMNTHPQTNDKSLTEGTRGRSPTLGIDIMLKATEQGLTRRETASMTGATMRQVCLACDRWAKDGVFLKKEKTGLKSTVQERAEILLERGDMTAKEIGIELGVSPQRISQIKKGLK